MGFIKKFNGTSWEDATVRKYNGTTWVESVAKKWSGDVWIPATSWSDFRDIVRVGKAQSLYPVGTKLYENWGDETSNAWIVVIILMAKIILIVI